MGLLQGFLVGLSFIITCTHAGIHKWEDCLLLPEPTECPGPWDTSNVTRYYFDRADYGCKEYPRGEKCSLNANYFETTLTCNITCLCSMPVDSGDGSDDNTSYFFNTNSSRCEEFTYRGSGGNANRFPSLEQCKERCLCGHPADEGTCHEPKRKFFYNGVTRRCQEFTYNGCRGNSNRFSTEEECNSACP